MKPKKMETKQFPDLHIHGRVGKYANELGRSMKQGVLYTNSKFLDSLTLKQNRFIFVHFECPA